MKVLIFPTDDRLGQASLIDHYNRIGCKVYVPKYGTLGLNWQKMSMWPAMLCNNETGSRNIDSFGTDKFSDFGEDHFLRQVGPFASSSDLPVCNILDEDQLKNTPIDFYHTLRGAEQYLHTYIRLSKDYFPNARWISSTMNAHDFRPESLKPHITAKILPAPYKDVPGLKAYCTDVEFRLFGMSNFISLQRDPEVASFNHNFHIRQPQDFALFTKMNEILAAAGEKAVVNYGGNIRGMGADIRYSADKGITGNYVTLSPAECLGKIKRLSAIIHFKQTDWGGGVFYHALHTSTPIITTKRYVNASGSNDYLIDGENCILVESPEAAAKAVSSIISNDSLRNKLIQGMTALKQKMFDDVYWKEWQKQIGVSH